MPTFGQIGLLILAAGAFAAGWGASLVRRGREDSRLRVAAKSLASLGVVLALAVLVWHSLTRGSWLPLEDNFDALIWLGVLLALFVLYVQRTRPLGGLDWFLTPIVVLLLVAAGVFGSVQYRAYVAGTWEWVHRVSAYGGAVAFAVAGAGGCLYLIAQRRLRDKTAVVGPPMGSLERLERLTFTSVTLGFALLTVGLVTGTMDAIHRGGGTSRLGVHWLRSPKVLLAFGAWVVYALVLHSPINPRFRGRRTALLSIIGLLLMIGVIVATQFMPAVMPEPAAVSDAAGVVSGVAPSPGGGGR